MQIKIQIDAIYDCLLNFLTFLGLEDAEDIPRDELFVRYRRIRDDLGRGFIQKIIKFNEQEFSLLDEVIRRLGQIITKYQDNPTISNKNEIIAYYRYIFYMEEISRKNDEILIPDILVDDVSENLGKKQIRAIELVIKALINEKYGDQIALKNKLIDLFGKKLVERWEKSADANDILSGTSFGIVSNTFVGKKEFPYHERKYQKDSCLTYLPSKRKSASTFLEDARQIRNSFFHHRSITSSQLAILQMYYEELIEPVQSSFDNGETDVNPSVIIDVEKDELDNYFKKLNEDVVSVKSKIYEIKELLSERTNLIQKDITKANTLIKILLTGIVIIFFCVLIGLFINKKINKDTIIIKDKTTKISERTKDIEETTKRIEKGVTVLSKSDGIIADPQSPHQYYHNFVILSQRGELSRSFKVLEKYLSLEPIYADPIIDYVSILIAKYGKIGASEHIKQSLTSNKRLLSIAEAYLADDIEDITRLSREINSSDDPYPPTMMILSQKIVSIPYDNKTDGLLKIAYDFKRALDRLYNSGELNKFFIDPKRLQVLLNDSKSIYNYFTSEQVEAFDRPLRIMSERYDDKAFIFLFWRSGFNRLKEPPEVLARFVKTPGFDHFLDLMDVETIVKLSNGSGRRDVAENLAKFQIKDHRIPGGLRIPIVDGKVRIEIKYTDASNIFHHYCIDHFPSDTKYTKSEESRYIEISECN